MTMRCQHILNGSGGNLNMKAKDNEACRKVSDGDMQDGGNSGDGGP